MVEFFEKIYPISQPAKAFVLANTVEHDGDSQDMRRVIFDLHCIGAEGEHFIVEMQQLYQDFFKDRAVYYTSRLINKQLARGRKGNDYQLPEVYFIGILEFRMGGNKGVDGPRDTERPYFYDVALCDRHTHEVFYDKLGYKLVSLADFNKSSTELHTVMDQWLYLLKHLSTMDKLPAFLDKRIFGLIFDVGEIGKLTKEELMSYEASLKYKRDAESVYNSAHRAGIAQGRSEGIAQGLSEGMEQGVKKGMEKGMEKGAERERAKAEAEKLAEKKESAIKMLQNGFEVEMISDILGLPVEEIEKLR